MYEVINSNWVVASIGVYSLIAVLYFVQVLDNLVKDSELSSTEKAINALIALLLAPFWLVLAVIMFVGILLEDNWY